MMAEDGQSVPDEAVVSSSPAIISLRRPGCRIQGVDVLAETACQACRRQVRSVPTMVHGFKRALVASTLGRAGERGDIIGSDAH